MNTDPSSAYGGWLVLMRKYRSVLALVVVLALAAAAVAGCTGGTTGTTGGTTGGTEPKPALKFAMSTDVGGLGDKSFNDLSWAGLEKAKADLGAEVKVLESKNLADYEPNLTQLASAGYSPVFAVGFLMTDAVTKVATMTPNTNFGGIDIFFAEPGKNVVGINFKEQEAGYLVGVVAGLATMDTFDPRLNKDNVIGFVGGMEIPPVVRYQAGFVAGAKSVNPNVKVISLYAGKFDDQAKGKELGLSLIDQKCDVVFAAAGQTGIGTFQACKESKKALFIGVDSDQFLTLTDPGDTILTSAIKRVDQGVFLVCKAASEGKFPGGTNVTYGLADDGVGIAPYHDFDAKVPQTIKDAVEKAKTGITGGTVTVPETVPK
jgi:basic membrane protein A and related proteins